MADVTEFINPHKYVDAKNKALYDSLISRGYKITLVKILNPAVGTNTTLWQCRPNQYEVSISYYEDIDTTGSFTHELYHVDIIHKGFPNFFELIAEIKNGNSTKEMLFMPCIGHISNMFGHVKFYDDFINLTYEPHQFVNDYHDPSNIDYMIEAVNAEFNSATLPNNSICYYMASFFTGKDNKNPAKEDDYKRLLSFLEEKDPILFGILDGHWKLWKNTKSYGALPIFKSLFDSTVAWHNKRGTLQNI